MNGRLLTGAALTGALELVGHWFPWPKPLHRIAAYLWGTGAILIGIAAITERRQWFRFFTITCAAGLSTIAAYIIDIHLRARQRRRVYERNS